MFTSALFTLHRVLEWQYWNAVITSILEKLDTLFGEVSGKSEPGKNQGSLEKWLTAGLGHIKYKLSLDHLVPEVRKAQEHLSHIRDTGTRLGTGQSWATLPSQ